MLAGQDRELMKYSGVVRVKRREPKTLMRGRRSLRLSRLTLVVINIGDECKPVNALRSEYQAAGKQIDPRSDAPDARKSLSNSDDTIRVVRVRVRRRLFCSG